MAHSAVIFDLDGTLVDTIPLWRRAYTQTFGDFGIEISGEDFIATIYVPSLSLKESLRTYGLPLDVEPAFRRKRDDRYVALLRSEAQWLPKAPDVLMALGERLPTAIATGSHRTYTDALDRHLRLYSYARCTLTCDDVRHDKPAPDMLLLAAERLAVPPEKCLYIGDQFFDVEAAKAAGMPCWIVPNSNSPAQAMKEADAILQHISEVLSAI